MKRKFTETVVVTTTKRGDPDNLVANVRANLTLQTALELRKENIKLITIDSFLDKSYIVQLQQLEVEVIPELTRSMGSIRRQAIRAGFEYNASVKYVIWIEPEKVNLIPYLSSAINIMENEQSHFSFFNRTSLRSYPVEQALYYSFIRIVFGYLHGVDIDYGFGPMIMTRQSSKYFLDYGGDYGDKWDSILIPRLRLIRDGMPYSVIETDFRNHPDQTRMEKGNIQLILKRVEQLDNVVKSMIAEHSQLYEIPN